jgi:hypothetical protein
MSQPAEPNPTPELPPVQVQPATPDKSAPARRSGDQVGLLVSVGVLVVGLLLGGWLWLDSQGGVGAVLSGKACADCGKIIEYADQGHDHIAKGATHPAYNSDPPTSGWHREEFVKDMSAAEIPEGIEDEVAVHMLEHGYLIAWYRCPAGTDCTAIREGLIRIAKAVPQDARYRLYVVPRSHLSEPNATIALSAWQHTMYLTGFDDKQVRDFVARFGGAVQEGMPQPTP